MTTSSSRENRGAFALWMALVLTLSACTASTTVLLPSLPSPERPVLPTVPAGSLECLTDEAYGRLVERDAVLQAYARQLKAIIEAHNAASEESK